MSDVVVLILRDQLPKQKGERLRNAVSILR